MTTKRVDREPTPEMIQAFRDLQPFMSSSYIAIMTWRAMFDAAPEAPDTRLADAWDAAESARKDRAAAVSQWRKAADERDDEQERAFQMLEHIAALEAELAAARERELAAVEDAENTRRLFFAAVYQAPNQTLRITRATLIEMPRTLQVTRSNALDGTLVFVAAPARAAEGRA